MLQCIWGASFFAFLEETRISLGAFVFLCQALSFFKTAIFRFPDYTFGPDRSLRLGGLDYIKGGVFTGSGPKARVHYSSGGWTHQVVYYPVYLFRKF